MSKKAEKLDAPHVETEFQLCAQPAPIPVVLPNNLTPPREYAIRISAKKWVNGTILHYFFLDRDQEPKWRWIEDQKRIVRWAFGEWKKAEIGLSFIEVRDVSEAEIRIGCLQDNRSWSYVGTDNLSNSDLGRTMNFGWDLTTAWGKATALHEIGHAIGLSHEHQNPNAGIIWNDTKVYEHFSGSPNYWDPPTIYRNILKKLDPSDVEGSNWDPTSIMEYPFDSGLIISPKPYDTQGIGKNTTLSQFDIDWVRRWYPVTGEPTPIAVMQLERLEAAAGQQRDYAFKPAATRDYKIQTIGESDCKVVIFEVRDNEPRHFISEDDSGINANLLVKAKMIKERTYVIRVRVNFIGSPDGVGLLIT